MKNKCDCYRTETKRHYTFHPIIGTPIVHDVEVGVCIGTKERDECKCDGDRHKCDFYPEVREKAIQEEDSLIVTYDSCSPDAPTLCVARKEGNKVKVLNTIQGDVAFGMYHYLTGGAELKEKEVITNADNIRSMSDEELAEYLFDIGWECHLCSEHERLDNEPLLREEKCDERCVQHCLEWLKQTVKK